MKIVRRVRPIRALGAAVILSIPVIAAAQSPSISSGSGSGTGTGMSSSSLGATGTGTESSTGLGTTGTGSEGVREPALRGARPGTVGGLTRPIDRGQQAPGENGPPAPLSGSNSVDPRLFLDANTISDPGERALALIRMAQTAIFSKQLEDAHKALFEAAPAAVAESQPLIRQQRIVAVIDALLSLAEERMSVTNDIISGSDEVPPPAPAANPGSNNPAPLDEARTPASALPPESRHGRLQAALPEWSKAVELAAQLRDITSRTEALFRIVESEAYSSQRLITDPLRSSGAGRPDPSTLPADIRSYTDELLVNSAKHAAMIERPIWRNSATYSIVSNAAASSQFVRGFEIARQVDQPETRTNILIRLAEGQALNGRPAEATAAYAEAARSVTQIPQTDPRETLVGVLIDSLISFGRFDDARSCIPLYTNSGRQGTSARQMVAYAAIAESQGRRNLADAARDWIAREIPAENQAQLYRKVNDGVLAAIEQNRSRDLTRRGN